MAWASESETEIRRGADSGIVVGKSCGDAFDRYLEEVSMHKRGERWESAAPQRHRRSGHWRPENQRYQTGQQFGSVQPTRPCGLHCASVQLFHQQSLATAVRHQFSLVQRDSLQRPRELVGGTPLLGVLSIAGNRAALLARLLAHSVDSGTPVSCATSATGLFAARSSG